MPAGVLAGLAEAKARERDFYGLMDALKAQIAGGEPLSDEQRIALGKMFTGLLPTLYRQRDPTMRQYSDSDLIGGAIINYQHAINPPDDFWGGFIVPVIAGALVGGAALGILPGGEAAAAAPPAAAASSAATAGAAAAGAGATTAATEGAAAGGVVATETSSASSIASMVSEVTSGIKDVVQQIKGFVGPIVGDIQSIVHDISSTVQSVNEELIKPIVGPIQQAITGYQALVDVLHRDISAGFQGLLRLPQDLSNALGSLDASLTRSLAMLNAGAARNLQDVLVPALLGKDGRTLGDLPASFESVLAPATGRFTPPPTFELKDAPDIEKYKEGIRADQEALRNGDGLAAQIVGWVVRSSASLEALAIQREPYNELWREELNRAFGIRTFEPGVVQDLWRRGELDRNDARDELKTQGFNNTRAEAIIAAARTLPDTSRILGWFANRWIDDSTARSMLRAAGWYPDDHDLLLNSAYREIGAGDLIDLMRRGLVGPQEVQASLERQGFRQFDARMLVEASNRLLGLQDLIQLYDRAAVADGGAGFASLREAPPPGLVAQGQKIGIGETDTAVLWSNHWRLLSPELACQAYFRGFINRPQLEQALASFSIPPELYDNFIDLQRPILPYRSVTSLVSQGILSEEQAFVELQKRGFDQITANWLVQIEKKAAAPSSSAAAEHVHGLTQTTVLQLYDVGTLSRSEAQASLAALGWDTDSIEATLTLHDVKAAADERAAAVQLVIAQAKAGLLSYQDAVTQLASLGLTATESHKAQASLTTTVTQQTKMPSEATLLAMWKHGIIDQGAALDALTLLGYSEAWAQLLIELEGASGTKQQ